MMRIVADENIPFLTQTFNHLGDLVSLPGRAFTRADVRDADLLLVRSVTPVTEELLSGSRVKYVATATIGTDHLDISYFDKAGIQWCAASGSNADSVADYFISCLVHICRKFNSSPPELTLGVIGCGNVGSRVAARAEALGMTVLHNDPPLARAFLDPKYVSLEELFSADIITLHTPLMFKGEDATFHLVDDVFLSRMKRNSVLVNTSRGAVVSGHALRGRLREGQFSAVLDVWEDEPNIDSELLSLVSIGTPHIAGYAIDGKIRGTWQIYSQVMQWLGEAPTTDFSSLLSLLGPNPNLRVDCFSKTPLDVIAEAAEAIHNLAGENSALRALLLDNSIGAGFDRLRKHYPTRREFSSVSVNLVHAKDDHVFALKAAGFSIIPN